MPSTISITGKTAVATVFASNLITHNGDVIFLTAYGPSQETRAFSQILLQGGSRMEVQFEDDKTRTIHDPKLAGRIGMLTELEHGYTALYVIPTGTDYIVGDNEAECMGILSRILDQHHFVLQAWYKGVRKLAEEVKPILGTKKCLITPQNIETEVQQRVSSGQFRFPVAVVSLTVEKAEEEKKSVA